MKDQQTMKQLQRQTIKQLQSQLSKLQGDLDAMRIEISNKQKEFNSKKKISDDLIRRINKLEKPTEVTISEHALLRYFERVLKFDLEEIKKLIVTEKVTKLIDELGESGSYPTGKLDKDGNEYRITLKNNVVVTVGI